MEVSERKTIGEPDIIQCKPCEERNVSTRAEGLCGECEEYMCNACFDTHKAWKLNKGHSLIESNKRSTPKEQISDFATCDQQFNEMINFHCPKHKQFGCCDCMILDQKTSKVDYILDKARTFKNSRGLKKMAKDVDKCCTEAKGMLSSIKNKKVQIVEINRKFNQEVNSLKDETTSHVNKLTNAMLRQGRDVMEMDVERMICLEKETEKMIDEFSLLTKEFESQIDRPKQFVSSTLQNTKFKRLRDQLDSMTGQLKIEKYGFIRDKSLERFANECKQLGRLQWLKQKMESDLQEEEEEERPQGIQKTVQAAGPPNLQPLLEMQLICRNIAVDGEYLSYRDNGNGDVGLYVYKTNCSERGYFEVEILSMGQRGTIAIGLVPESYPENLQLGWGSGSIGYHSDNMMYKESESEDNLDEYEIGDLIGCAVCWLGIRRVVFFTKNGREVKNVKVSPLGFCHFAVEMHSEGQKVRVIPDNEKSDVEGECCVL